MRSPKNLFSSFDEETYLDANRDIREAVATGVVSSGLEHYRRWGRHERRQGVDSTATRPVYQPLSAIPPDALRLRVTGSADLASFEEVGRLICDDVLDAMAMYRIGLAADSHVLDFGSGCGRVLRHFAPQCSAARIDGADIDEEAIAWCRGNFPASVAFHHNTEWPPLPFEDARFDLIYSISVFTHLPEAMQLAWLAELSRVAKPGAWLLLSIHASELISTDDPGAAEQMETLGFSYLRRWTTDGLPDFYRTAYHSDSYIHREWGKLFEIEAIIKKGVNDHQDLVVGRAIGPAGEFQEPA